MGDGMNAETVRKIGLIASVVSVLMYVSYIPQIIDNLHGSHGNPIQPAVACLNCILWTLYGFFSKPKNKPVIFANVPGIFLSAICVITSFM